MPSVSPLPASAIDQIVEATYGRVLASAGFSVVAKRRWVRPRLEWCYDVFELQTLKGAAISARWGLSLSYVPHVQGDRLRWHRTIKSAVLDLTIDPVDFLDPNRISGQALSTLGDADALRSQAEQLSPISIAEAGRTWNAATSLEGVALLLEHRRCAQALRFGFYNYVRHPIAYAFTLAKLGRMAEARAELAKALRDATPIVRSILLAALEEAQQDAT